MPKQVKKTISYDLSLSLEKAELASSLPPPFYTSKTLAQQEIELFFRQSWIGVGRSDIVSVPGDYITLDVANQQIILLRDKRSKLRAFANTCRHRNARIIDGKGTCKGLRCPFHSWFYDLEGKLISKPKTREEAIEILQKLNGKKHQLISSVCISKNGSMIWNYTDSSNLTMKQLNLDEIKSYLNKIKDNELYAYGVYQIEADGKSLFSKIEGDEDTIMGLPVKKIKEYLKTIK